MPPGKITSEKPSASSSCAGRIGVLPPSTMLAISGSPLADGATTRPSSLALARRLDEQHVGAGLAIERARARWRASKPSTATASVRAMISVSRERARIDRRLDLADHFLRRDQRLVVEMAAALGEVLVLELDGVGAGALEQTHGALDIERIAVAGVGVDDEMRADAVADQRQRLDHLAHADEADVGPAEPRVGDGRAGDVERLEAGLLGDQRRQRIVDAGRDQDRRAAPGGRADWFQSWSQSQISTFELGIGGDVGGGARHHERPSARI